ncbi:hypothetical protein Lfu02_28810 [Longispora fulva]|nr:hypothetical protein Lfu02_28810 [Longispora fulva]
MSFGTVVAALLAGVGATAAPAYAAPADLFVNNAVVCSDAGPGSQAQPFCTLSAGAAAVTAGQTVRVTGSYAEHLTIAKSGTAGSPVTFRPATDGDTSLVQLTGTSAGITVSGQHDVTILGFQIQGAPAGPAVNVVNSTRMTIERVELLPLDSGSAAAWAGVRLASVTDSALNKIRVFRDVNPAITLDAATSGVVVTSAYIAVSNTARHPGGIEVLGPHNTVVRSAMLRPVGTGILVAAEATGTVLASNIISTAGGTGIDNSGASGTAIANNNVANPCGAGIRVSGASSGVSVQNNFVYGYGGNSTTCANGITGVGVGVYDAAVSGTTVDYNTVRPNPGKSPYAWTTPVASLAAFRAASSQGAHDLDSTDVNANVDSGNAAAPGRQLDYYGKSPVDDPEVPNTGSGPVTYADRGARELTMAPSAELTITQKPGGEVTVDASTSRPGWLPITSYTFDFVDGTVVTQATPVAHHTYADRGLHQVEVTVKDDNGDQGIQVKGFVNGDGYVPVSPVRVLDTRAKIGVGTTTPVEPGGTVTLQVAGSNGLPATGVTSVTMNVTVTEPTANGFLTVYPNGQFLPNASNLNWTPGLTAPNLVVVSVVNGKVDFHNTSSGTVHVVADLVGYHSAVGGSVFVPLGPVRVLDTRAKIGVDTTTPIAPGGTLTLPALGGNGVPATGVTSVTMNVTVTDPTANGFLTVYPDGQALPNASNLNWTPGLTAPNLVVVPVVNGKVAFHNTSPGTVHVVADLVGYHTTGAGSVFHDRSPFRVLDTRSGIGADANTPVWPGGWLDLNLMSMAREGATAVILNVTVTEPKASGFLTVTGDFGHEKPNASNLNWRPGQTVPNLVVVPLNPVNGTARFYNTSSGSVHVVADVVGYYGN